MSQRNHDIIIQGIEWDKKSSFLRGTAKAPSLIRDTLNNGSSNYYSEDGTDTNSSRIVDKGDFKIEEYFEIENITKVHLQKGAKLLSLGGDHSVTYPIVKALGAFYSKIDILHIDAHSDLYDNYDGDKYSHACPFARIMELGIVENLVQVGIRTLNPHQKEQAKKFGIDIRTMENLNLSTITHFKNPLYISLDMDAFDPAYAPGVSHLEPGGLSSRQVINLIQNLQCEIIGADIVEYNPQQDVNKMTTYLCAKMFKELVAKMM